MQQRLALRVPGSDDGLRQAAAAADRFCAGHEVPASARWKLQVVLDELLSNVVRYAYAGRDAGEISLEFFLAPPALGVTVVDDGPPFNPLLAPAPRRDIPLDDRTPGGLGIALVRSLAQEARYERREGGNAVTVTIRWPDEAATAADQQSGA